MTSTFRDKVQQLEQELAKCNKTIESCGGLSNVAIGSIAAPIVIFLALYFLSPGFVKVKNGKKDVRSFKKVIIWSFLISTVAWASIYGYSQYSNGGASAPVI